MTSCTFCRIATGEIPALKVYEDKEYVGFLDINPINKGHTLIVPKKHVQWVYDVVDQGSYWKIAQKIAKKILAELKAEYVMFVTWGLEVHHAHIHVVPRYENDHHKGFLDWEAKVTVSQEEMKEIARKITIIK